MKTERFNKYFATTAHFRLTNPNPAAAKEKTFEWKRGDCAIRAIANSTGCTWLQSFDWLAERARTNYYTLNDMGGVRQWLNDAGCKWTACKAVKGQKRMTCLGFAETHPQGRFVIQVANHLTACVNGVILDAWNCGEKAVVGYFAMDDFKL